MYQSDFLTPLLVLLLSPPLSGIPPPLFGQGDQVNGEGEPLHHGIQDGVPRGHGCCCCCCCCCCSAAAAAAGVVVRLKRNKSKILIAMVKKFMAAIWEGAIDSTDVTGRKSIDPAADGQEA